MLYQQFGKDNRYGLFVAGRSEITEVMRHTPEAIVLATPNPVGEAVKDIAQTASRPFVLILPQNGVGVVEQARAVVDKNMVPVIVRASLFTPVNEKEGGVFYNQKKLRIAVALENASNKSQLAGVEQLFKAAGFEVVAVEDYESMEWTKLLANCLGSTSTVTGLPPSETFTDPDLFALEIRGLKDRIRIIENQGISVADIPWIKPLRLLKSIPEGLPYLPRWVIAEFIAAGRDNLPSAAARKIEEGGYPAEAVEYHRPFTLAKSQSPVDESLLSIIEKHNRGEINLGKMLFPERRRILLETVMKNINCS